MIIYNNAANVNAAAPGMADDGRNGQFVTIPVISMTRADAFSVIERIGQGVTAFIGVDMSIRAGADHMNRARLYAPFPISGTLSISHFDPVATKNLLMEPDPANLFKGLTHNVKAPHELTFELLSDLGWIPDADSDGVRDEEDCNPHSDVRPTIVIGTRNTGVPNTVFADGCTSADLIAQLAASAANKDEFVSAVADLTDEWVEAGLITGAQKGAIQSAAAKYRL